MDTPTTVFGVVYFVLFFILGIATLQWWWFLFMILYPIFVLVQYAMETKKENNETT